MHNYLFGTIISKGHIFNTIIFFKGLVFFILRIYFIYLHIYLLLQICNNHIYVILLNLIKTVIKLSTT